MCRMMILSVQVREFETIFTALSPTLLSQDVQHIVHTKLTTMTEVMGEVMCSLLYTAGRNV